MGGASIIKKHAPKNHFKFREEYIYVLYILKYVYIHICIPEANFSFLSVFYAFVILSGESDVTIPREKCGKTKQIFLHSPLMLFLRLELCFMIIFIGLKT